jgi:hypothetical protein
VYVVGCGCGLQELAEREKGNEHYRKGEWAQALQCYTRCIAINRSVDAYAPSYLTRHVHTTSTKMAHRESRRRA